MAIRVAVIGAGRAGLVHAVNYRDHVPGAQLVALIDTDAAACDRAAGELGAVRTYTSVSDALAAGGIDAVVITTPTFTHAPIVAEAAAAGVHVFCEKPMALNLAEAEAMTAAAARAGIKLQIGFMRRYDPVFRAAREAIVRGDIGRVMQVKSTGRGPGLPPRWAWNVAESNGMLAEVQSHDFDSVRWLAGAEYARVYAEVAALKATHVLESFADFYDNAAVVGRLSNGALVLIDGACPVDYGYDARVEVLGSEGMLVVGETAMESVVITTKQGGVRRSAYPSWRDRFRSAYIEEARAFVRSIRENQPPSPGGEDGIEAVRVVLAAMESVRAGRPVQVAEVAR
ncbi:MAG TPA: Gfo/Idh/MocA family oxidoreductase [Symbiobacteriaceae bacterium]|nr:Gfo/Idh/MocA family oxidoreductase [Symbiobacteriaceae bacterium]